MVRENSIKIIFVKISLFLVVIAFLYFVISNLYKICYLELHGVETTGKVVVFRENVISGKRKLKLYTPIVRIKLDGKDVDMPATLNKIDKDLAHFVGDKVKVKYSLKNPNLIIINEKIYLLNRINDIILVLQFLVFALLAIRMNGVYKKNGKIKWIIKKKNISSDLILWLSGILFSILWIYYQIILGKFALEQFDFLGALATFMFLVVYSTIVISFVKTRKFT